jgi:lipopolysaccharide transport system ATP-binding protein
MYALEVHNISKTYHLYTKPSDRLKEMLLRRPFHRKFEPLRNISFVLPHGGILGIIGTNGAGKSTLLKILAGTLSPSSGHIVQRGRVAALLELGAGFHPEFSGRQNIYLNAALLGLTDAEIRAREQDIIDFSELNQFIDRPVKTYSSGMYVRLAFAIATSVNPDILIIDEALSVGDANFQKKCVKRMNHFKDQGKTILFCSHDLYRIQELCHDVIWLKEGRIEEYDSAATVVSAYLAHLEHSHSDADIPAHSSAVAPEHLPDVVITGITVQDAAGNELEQLQQFHPIHITIHTRRPHAGTFVGHIGIVMVNGEDKSIFITSTKHDNLAPIHFNGVQTFHLCLPSLSLAQGKYSFKAMIGDESALHIFSIYQTPAFTVFSDRPELGLVWMQHEWRIPE